MPARSAIAIALLVLLTSVASKSQEMPAKKTIVKIAFVSRDFKISDLDNAAWRSAEAITVDRYWSGVAAPKSRKLVARLLWSDDALYVRFEGQQKESLIISDKPDLTKKT